MFVISLMYLLNQELFIDVYYYLRLNKYSFILTTLVFLIIRLIIIARNKIYKFLYIFNLRLVFILFLFLFFLLKEFLFNSYLFINFKEVRFYLYYEFLIQDINRNE